MTDDVRRMARFQRLALELPSQPAANYTFTATVFGGRDRAARARAEASIHVPDQETR